MLDQPEKCIAKDQLIKKIRSLRLKPSLSQEKRSLAILNAHGNACVLDKLLLDLVDSTKCIDSIQSLFLVVTTEVTAFIKMHKPGAGVCRMLRNVSNF